jgi:hypothetical protein
MRISRILAISSILIITVIFVAVISPLKGFGILTPLLLLIGILLWVGSLILLLAGYFNKHRDRSRGKSLIITLILVAAFIPIGIIYSTISENVRTKITVIITNQSDYIPYNISVYGAGSIFENPDTMKMGRFGKGEQMQYTTWPATKPFRSGYIRMDFDIDGKHISKDIAGEFSINPYFIQQEWEITVDNEFVNYSGIPYSDSLYNRGAQSIPGRVQCEYFDSGGEGVAFHDNDTINSGSGRLNPADGSYLHEFRINEAVDISFTKFREPPVDNSRFNFTEPEKNQLYVGWTEPGEWTRYTVNVKKPGTYQLGIMYTSNQNGKISVSVNDSITTGPVLIPTTYVEADSVAWRQWHHWNYLDDIATLDLKEGIQTITISTIETGQMNYDYINFKLDKSAD